MYTAILKAVFPMESQSTFHICSAILGSDLRHMLCKNKLNCRFSANFTTLSAIIVTKLFVSLYNIIFLKGYSPSLIVGGRGNKLQWVGFSTNNNANTKNYITEGRNKTKKQEFTPTSPKITGRKVH